MSLVKTDKSPIEVVRKLLETGMVYKEIERITGTSKTELSIISKVLGMGRKRGPVPGTVKYKPRKKKTEVK
jgi:uncharacterized protein YerC